VELSYALTWMIGTSAAFGLVLSIQQLRAGIRGGFYVNLALLAVVGFGLLVEYDGIGYLALLLWGLLVILPGRANQRAQEALYRQQLDQAALWARVAGALHPFDDQREQARLLTSHAYFERGDVDAAKGVLYPLLKSKGWAERAKMELLRFDGRFTLIVEHAKAQAVGKRDLKLAPLYLRALGEVGDLDAMWIMYGQVPPVLANQPVLRLQMATYSGQRELVELLLGRYFAQMPQNHSDLVRATTMFAEGRPEEAERLLAPIIRNGGKVAAQASLRLAHPLAKARLDELSANAVGLLSSFGRDVRAIATSALGVGRPQRSWATPLLIAVILVMFLVGVPGGATDPENLVGLGALVLPSQLTNGGIAWRIVAAGFLHLGITHLVMNGLGLWVLGKQIEELWGGVALLGIFLASSVGSFGFAAAFVEASVSEPRIFLGASAGVMGLVGALATFLATGFLLHRRQALGWRLLLVAAVVLAQLVFDHFTPIVSSMLHLTGLGLGAVAAVPFALRTWRNLGRARR
jgi:rhomboid protease GluP